MFPRSMPLCFGYFRTCLKITIRLIWGKFAPVLRYFFRQIARIWLQKNALSRTKFASN